jgi:integrase
MYDNCGRQRPDISEAEIRLKLRARSNPYYALLCQGRALGYRKRVDKPSFWIARATKSPSRYVTHRLGLCDDSQPANGKTILNFAQAEQRAWEWFKKTSKNNLFTDIRPLGELPDIKYRPYGDVYTVGHALYDYIVWKRLGSSPSHIQAISSIANYHLIPRIATLAADALTAETYAWLVREILETSADRGRWQNRQRLIIKDMDAETLRRRKITLNKVLTVLRLALKMAWENGKTNNERCWHVIRNIPNRANRRQLFLNRAECKLLLKHCKPDLKHFVLGALYTGCRATELRRMQVKDVGHNGYGIYVESAKSQKPRFVFLPDEGMAFFLRLAKGRDANDFLFLRENGTPWRERYTPPFKQAMAKAGIPREFTFHGLRHTYASQLVQAGTPLIVVAEQLGHADTQSVSKTYGHFSPQIRESEVRQRFSLLSKENAEAAARQRRALNQLRRKLHGGNWRTYALISKTQG